MSNGPYSKMIIVSFEGTYYLTFYTGRNGPVLTPPKDPKGKGWTSENTSDSVININFSLLSA